MTSGNGWSVLQSRYVHSVFGRPDTARLATRVGYHVSRSCWLTSLVFGAPKFYWGPNATKKEGKGDSSFPLVRT